MDLWDPELILASHPDTSFYRLIRSQLKLWTDCSLKAVAVAPLKHHPPSPCPLFFSGLEPDGGLNWNIMNSLGVRTVSILADKSRPWASKQADTFKWEMSSACANKLLTSQIDAALISVRIKKKK